MIEVNNNLGKRYVTALVKKYEADMAEAEATLALYMEKLTAIGEHSELMDEHDKWIEKYTTAKDKLDTTNELFFVKI